MGNAAKTMKKLFSVWPLLFLIILWAFFASPFLFQGKIPFAGDYQVTFFPPWSQYAQFNQPVKNNVMPDVIDQLYPWKHLVITDWKAGEIPLWNPYNFSGTPLLANYQSAPFTPLNLLFFAMPFTVAWGFLVLLQPLLAGVGMYFFARKLSISQIASTLSSVAFMFCGFIVCWMGYGTLGYAIGVLPFVLLGLEGFVQTRKIGYALLVSLGLAFSLLSGHFQISIYTAALAFFYFLFRFLPTKHIATILSGFLLIVLGILIASVQLFPSIAFYAQSLRSTLFIRPEIIPWQHFLTNFAPDFFGNPVTRNDWFGHYAEWNSYIGVLPFVFSLFSLTLWRRNRFVRFFSLSALVALLLATPTIFGDLLLYAHVPVLGTSAASRIIVVMSFSLAVLAGFGLDAWILSSEKKKLLVGVISVLLLALGWGVILLRIGFPQAQALVAKQNFVLPSLFLLCGLIGSLILLFARNKRAVLAVSFVLLVISAFDMYRFAVKWQSFSDQSFIFPNIPITKFFQGITNERSLGNYGGQVSLYYQLPSLEGYDALYPQRIGEFMSYVADGKLHPASRSVVEFSKNGRYAKETLDLLGVKYIIHKISDTNKPWAFAFWDTPQDFTIVYKDDQYIIVKNKNAYPRAFLTNNFIIPSAKEDLLGILFAKSTDRRNTLLLEEDPHIASVSSFQGEANIVQYSANTVQITTNSSADGLLFLSDTFFPGWKAYVDGHETKIFRADYTFRSVVVPGGKHTVVFSYWPSSFVYGGIVSVVGLIFFGSFYFFQKKSER